MLREKSQWHPHFDANFPQEEELLQEVEQLMDRDAPPDTLGVEILLIFGFRTSLRAPTILGVRNHHNLKPGAIPNQPRFDHKLGISRPSASSSRTSHDMVTMMVHPGVEKVIWVALLIFGAISIVFIGFHWLNQVLSQLFPTLAC